MGKSQQMRKGGREFDGTKAWRGTSRVGDVASPLAMRSEIFLWVYQKDVVKVVGVGGASHRLLSRSQI